MVAKRLLSVFRPRKSLETLDLNATRLSTYIVFSKGKYHYFPVVIKPYEGDSVPPILRFEKGPPLLIEGFVRHKRATYLITPQDILRGIIRTSQVYTSATQNESTRSQTVSDHDNDAVEESFDSELVALADVAFQEQVETLQNLDASQEEWEEADSA